MPQAFDIPVSSESPTLTATAPGQLRLIKRNGQVAPYDASKIAVAMTKAFLAVEGDSAGASTRIRETVANLTQQIDATFKRRMPSGGTIHIEEVQDLVELTLMRAGEQKVARDYVLYREERSRLRKQQAAAPASSSNPDYPIINVTREDGTKSPLDFARLQTVVREACQGLEGVSEKAIIDEAMRNLYDGVSVKDVTTSLVITARTLVEKEPNYTYATSRL